MQANPGPHAAREKLFHRLFEIGVWIKGIDGLIETAGGILLLTVSLQALNSYVIALTQDEIQEDSGDLIANALRHAAEHLTESSKLTAGAYLLGNGFVKVFLATCILRGKLWCYPVAMAVISLFILLQCGRLGFHFSWPMFTGTIIDVAIVLLIWREYRKLKI
ncbi:MAG TPA: DUF2127 domain-containing protein [Candidatus Acidoferrales bacterium]|jgi:uncharacterized membrane protein|nr:DUF2127 domain-containing protein [Candidatus Acidoferrales bacterium]